MDFGIFIIGLLASVTFAQSKYYLIDTFNHFVYRFKKLQVKASFRSNKSSCSLHFIIGVKLHIIAAVGFPLQL